MPNGFQGPVEDWDRMESPLRSVDARLTNFANAHRTRV